jgi:hypothetical protein
MNLSKRLATVLLIGLSSTSLLSCANPAVETYQKGIKGGEKSIDKARSVQQTVDLTKTTAESTAEQTANGGTQSP